LIRAGYIDCDPIQSRDKLNKFMTLNYVVRDISTNTVAGAPKPKRPEPMRLKINGNNKEMIKPDLNNSLSKPLSPEIGEMVSAQQVVYSESGRRALEAGNHPVYVGSKPYDAWLALRGPDGMPGFVDRILVNGQQKDVVWMPSISPPRRIVSEDDGGGV
jgi:hypothetical protein